MTQNCMTCKHYEHVHVTLRLGEQWKYRSGYCLNNWKIEDRGRTVAKYTHERSWCDQWESKMSHPARGYGREMTVKEIEAASQRIAKDLPEFPSIDLTAKLEELRAIRAYIDGRIAALEEKKNANKEA